MVEYMRHDMALNMCAFVCECVKHRQHPQQFYLKKKKNKTYMKNNNRNNHCDNRNVTTLCNIVLIKMGNYANKY